MRCAGCDVELTAMVFPGGVIVCPSCGAQNRTTVTSPGAVPGATPYRVSPDRPTLEPADFACPFCGGTCSSDARACPHCEVRLSSVRCPTCFALQTTGQGTCTRCGHALTLEPLLDPTDAPCPRCNGKLSALGGNGMNECAACGGVFLDHAALARIVEERGASGPIPATDARPFERAHHPVADTNVRYLKCPQCHQTMNRTNFGRKSGVVVDVCKVHGTWFDSGELTQAAHFIASGGLEQAKAHAAAAPAAGGHDARITRAQAEVQVAMMTESMRETRDLGRRVALTENLVDAAIRALLWW